MTLVEINFAGFAGLQVCFPSLRGKISLRKVQLMHKQTNQVAYQTAETQGATLEQFQGERQVLDKEVGQSMQIALLTIPQVSKSLGLSRAKIYMLIANEGLPVVRFGRAIRVSPISLNQWLQKREQGLIA